MLVIDPAAGEVAYRASAVCNMRLIVPLVSAKPDDHLSAFGPPGRNLGAERLFLARFIRRRCRSTHGGGNTPILLFRRPGEFRLRRLG